MSQALNEILNKIHALPLGERQQLQEILNIDAERERRMKLSSTIKGKYANLMSSSDDFCARKTEEIELEDRRSKQ
jgi:hypothetical protein